MLVHHNIVFVTSTRTSPKRVACTYEVQLDEVIDRVRFPKYTQLAQRSFGFAVRSMTLPTRRMLSSTFGTGMP